MINRHHTKRPKNQHILCDTQGCNNYYNQLHKNTDNKCKPCRTRNKQMSTK